MIRKGLHNSESSKGRIDQLKFATGHKSLFHCSLEEILKLYYLIEVGLLQHFLQLRKLSRTAYGSRAVCCAGLD